MHKNSYQNSELHHLYAIIDRLDESIFKYGISCMPIDNSDDMSSRMREQVTILNLANRWNRFYTKILLKEIEGKKEARRIETKMILDYETAFGERPRGNLTL